uniref:Uncharacterized protein n=1 Tax=Myotis myotis TaxID=51298 RepID=A0A7J7Z4I7_MYOMY|nr:hypothetical protein mMyoMyo1_010516 [Myotis myotis]
MGDTLKKQTQENQNGSVRYRPVRATSHNNIETTNYRTNSYHTEPWESWPSGSSTTGRKERRALRLSRMCRDTKYRAQPSRLQISAPRIWEGHTQGMKLGSGQAGADVEPLYQQAHKHAHWFQSRVGPDGQSVHLVEGEVQAGVLDVQPPGTPGDFVWWRANQQGTECQALCFPGEPGTAPVRSGQPR